MDDDKLNKLITALETSDHRYYQDDIREDVIEALKELRDAREKITEIKDILSDP